MKKGSKYITRTQRLMLEDCFNAKLSKKKIAQKIGMSLSTVYRELERGKCTKRRKNTTLTAVAVMTNLYRIALIWRKNGQNLK